MLPICNKDIYNLRDFILGLELRDAQQPQQKITWRDEWLCWEWWSRYPPCNQEKQEKQQQNQQQQNQQQQQQQHQQQQQPDKMSDSIEHGEAGVCHVVHEDDRLTGHTPGYNVLRVDPKHTNFKKKGILIMHL